MALPESIAQVRVTESLSGSGQIELSVGEPESGNSVMEQAGSLTASVETGIETMLRAGKQTVEARCLVVFLYLQVLDLLTTLVGLRLGLQEMSPFLRWLMQVGPAVGLLIAKSAAFLLAAFCFASHRERVVYRINYFFAGLVLWNLILIVTAR